MRRAIATAKEIEMTFRPLLALGAVLAAFAAAAQPQLEPPRYNQVDLQAEVSREVQNDLMTAGLYAEANDASAARVADQLNRSTADALKIAGEFKSVKTRSGFTNTFPVYDRAGKLTGWRGRSEIRLESKDFAAMANLIGKLQSSMQLGNVGFTVSPELRRQTENELITEAVAAFRSRAEIAAKAIGGKSYKIRRIGINTGGMFPGPRPMMAERAVAAAAPAVAPPAFEGGTSMVQVTANGSVEVE
jgi:predicted secreted protein